MDKTVNNSYKVALVALDFTEMDDRLISYTALISKTLPFERIFFVHVAKNLELSQELLAEYPSLTKPLDESLEADMQTKVDHHFASSKVETICIVKEGSPIDQVLKLCRIKDVDLILMGRKKSLQGSGIVSSRIARKCPCSLLLVTEDSSLKIKKLLLPIDFSSHSELALKLASDVHKTSKAELLAMHIYSVPIGFYKTGKSYDEFSVIMRKHAEKDYERFLKKHNTTPEIQCKYVLAKDDDYSEMVYRYADDNKVDLIVIGSRGRTDIASVLLGSMAEKLVYLNNGTPILIVKEKGENMGFLDVLMKI